MDDKTLLEVLLFAHLAPGDTKHQLLINPNFAQGISVSTQNGEVLYTLQPGVSTEGASLIDASGEKIATVRESVHDSVVYDFGQGETAVSMPDILGGSKVLDHGEGFIGFTRPTFDGSLELQNQFHQSMASLNGADVLLEQNAAAFDFSASIPEMAFGSTIELFEVADTAADAMDILDVADVLGDLF